MRDMPHDIYWVTWSKFISMDCDRLQNFECFHFKQIGFNEKKYNRWENTGPGRGGTDLERGYGDVRAWRSPFHASPAARKGPISSKRVSSQDPLLRKFENFSLYSLNFCPNSSSQAPKFENFQLTSPKIGKLSAPKPPNLEIFSSQAPLFRGKYPFPSPTLQKSGPHTPT